MAPRGREKRPSSPSTKGPSTGPSKKKSVAAREPATGAGRGRGRRERLDVDERRAQLVRLGIDLFAARTYDEVSIDELARAAGVSKGLLYHYFPTKRDFYVATVREGAAELLARTDTPTHLSPLERMRAGLDAYLDYVEEHAPAYAALMRGGIGSDPEVARIVDETRGIFVERLLEGLPVPLTPLVRVAARGHIGFCEAVVTDWLVNRAVDRAAVRDLMGEVLLAIIPIVTR
jgi:AcrR family transcriptional regulator